MKIQSAGTIDMGRDNGIDFVAIFDRTDYSDTVEVSTDYLPRFDDLFETNDYRQTKPTERYMVFKNAYIGDAAQEARDRTRTYEDWMFLGIVAVLRGDVTVSDLNDADATDLVSPFVWTGKGVEYQPKGD